MACAGQEHRIVAELYGELSPDERDGFTRHLADCAACRTELDELGRARTFLQEARPAVPLAPRVVVLTPRASRFPSYAVAASLAAVGLLAGVALSWSWQARAAAERAAMQSAPQQSAALAAAPTTDQIEALLDAKLAQFRDEERSRVSSPAPILPAGAVLTRSELDARLAKMERKIDRTRADDVRYLLGEMEGVENRTGMRLGQTQEAIRYLALASDPRISER